MAEYDNAELIQQALLYAAGEMDQLSSAAFEVLLERDASAQDALTHVVQLNLVIEGRSLTPNRAYRDVVRKQSRSQLRWRERSYWFAGVCAASVLIVGFWAFNRNPITAQSDEPKAAVQAEPVEPSTVAKVETEPEAASEDISPMDEPTAVAWAEMSNSDHLHRALDDEQRHKVRMLRKDEMGHHRPWMQVSKTSP
jgi:hypothetical protein